jgi:probable HAF family extracellular repeat protein
MKSKIIVIALWIALTAQFSLAQGYYTLINLGNLDGTQGFGNSINRREWVGGAATLAGDNIIHAVLWRNRSPLDLGTIGDPETNNSGIFWPVKNSNGLIVGVSQTDDIDPYDEVFSCEPFFGTPANNHACQGFKWQDGVMTALPTLGGTSSYATGANNLGQIVGWAENTIHDPSCVLPQVLQFKAVIWGPGNNQMTVLPPLQGDSTSAATAINDKGDVVGISGSCYLAYGFFSAAHSVIWHNGIPSPIPTFGGKAWNTPTAINSKGQVAGFSDFPGDDDGTLNAHAFFWKGSGPLTEIKPLPQHALSLAFGMNNKGQVVGQSFRGSPSRAFLWQNGTTLDVNQLIAPGSSLHLFYANDINDAGEITGAAVDLNTGDVVAFLAIPPEEGTAGAIALSRENGNDSRQLSPAIRKAIDKHPTWPLVPIGKRGAKQN